ncbi:MAG: zinc carboxypeptidase [Holophagales bacterium]|nr:MAG: zinc carboxypeptidase [Holophagales bacterium]
MRRLHRFLLGSALALLSLSGTGAAEDRPRYLRVHGVERSGLAALARLADVDGVDDDGTVRVYTTPEGVAKLLAAGYVVEELPDPGINPDPGTRADGRVGEAWDTYPSWSGYVAMMNQFETDCGTTYPDICHLVDLGPSANTSRPHRLYAIRISDNPSLDEDEPEVLLTSSIHGDETVGAMLLLHLIDELLRNYDPASVDPVKQEITALVNGVEIWINPFANPDGTYYTSDASVSGAIRFATNANGTSSGVDMNRNFPDVVDGLHPDGYAWRLETQTMMAFASARHFNLSTNFHGGAEVVNYPWDVWCSPHVHPDDDWWRVVARDYATHAQANPPYAGYMNDLDNGITEGCDWYVVNGGRQDYMNYWQYGREMTIEVSGTKNPAGSTLPGFWTANRQALLDLLKQPLAGVRGLVRSNPSLAPLAGHVEVVGRDKEHTQVGTDPAVGDYHRALLPGTYTLRFYAAGHQTLTVPGVVVASGPATRLDVALEPVVGELFADGFDFGGAVGWTLSFP